MHDLTVFFLLAMATWRVASLLVREAGPWRVFVWIRARAGIQHEEDGTPSQWPDTTLAGILSCVWCCSVWVAAGWLAFWMVSPELAAKIAAVFAISTGAILVDKWLGN